MIKILVPLKLPPVQSIDIERIETLYGASILPGATHLQHANPATSGTDAEMPFAPTQMQSTVHTLPW
jgi:adenylosuccinate lyase